jgi:hypothetical protein
MNPYLELARRWERIADQLDKRSVEMTACTHRLFANELRAVIALHSKAGFCWGGRMVHGDHASVAEVRRLVERG